MTPGRVAGAAAAVAVAGFAALCLIVATLFFSAPDSTGTAGAAPLAGDLAGLAQRLGVPERALAGVVLVDGVSLARVGCRAPWWLLLSVTVEESGAGTHGGATIGADWVVRPHIGGPNLGFEFAYDAAQGPFQFISTSWAAMGEDYDGDGVADPHHFLDAALGAANHLCLSAGGPGTDLGAEAAARAGLYGYNHDVAYGLSVWARAVDYRTQGGDQPARGQAAALAPPGSPTGQLVDLPADLCGRPAGCRLDASWAPNLVAALRAAGAAGHRVTVFSAYRSYGEQAAIYARNCPTPACPGGLTAAPGTSNHEGGQAVDVDVAPGDGAWEWLTANGARFGVLQCGCITGRDPVHFSATGR